MSGEKKEKKRVREREREREKRKREKIEKKVESLEDYFHKLFCDKKSEIQKCLKKKEIWRMKVKSG